MNLPAFLKNRWIVALIGLAVVAAAGFFIYSALNPEEVLAYRLTRQDVVATLTVTGEVEADESVSLSPKVTARIEEITVDEGVRVRQGQVLVRLDQDELLANLRQAEARVAEARANVDVLRQGAREEEIARLQAQIDEIEAQIRRNQAGILAAQAEHAEASSYAERVRQLFQTGAASAQELDQAVARATVTREQVSQLQADIAASRARIEQLRQQILSGQRGATAAEVRQGQAAVLAAQASVQAIRDQLADRVLRSPADAMVIDRLRDPGELGQPGEPILRLADRGTLEVIAQVEESDLSRVNVGDTAIVVLDALPESSFEATVTRVGEEVNPENGTVRTTLHLTKGAMSRLVREIESVDLLPGMTADVNIITGRLSNQLVLPASAVRKEGARYFAYRFVDHRLERVPVNVRRISVEYYQILDGLAAGDWVAKLATEDLLLKKRVKPLAAPLPEDEEEEEPAVPAGFGQ